LDVKQNAAGSVKAMVDMLTSAHVTHAATTADTPDGSDRSETASQIALEYWAARVMWLLVTVTCSWDIAVTFGQHFALTGRYF
jgi:hypothetical protein